MKKLTSIIFALLLPAVAYAGTCEDNLMGSGVPALQAANICTNAGDQSIGGTLAVTGATTLTGAQTLTGATALNGGATVASGQTLKLDVGTIAAAGSDQTDATAIVDQLSYVTAADGAKGVILPASTGSGALYVVHNADAASGLLVYPDASGQINGGTATTGDVTVAAEETAIFIDAATNVWHGGVAVDF